MFQAQARAVIRRDGSGVMEIGAHDMGQGAATALAQIAADGLGLDVDQVEFRTGTSDLPDAGIAGGSAHTATAGMAIHSAGADVIAKLAELAMGDAAHRCLVPVMRALWRGEGDCSAETMKAAARAMAISSPAPGSRKSTGMARAQRTRRHSRITPCMRTRRVCGGERRSRVGAEPCHSSGRCLRRRPGDQSATCTQPVLWRHDLGVSFALHEQAVMDLRSGRPMNPNLGEYHVPVHADVPSLEAILIEEHDPHVNALGIKGVGEIGVTGTAGEIANAVWHATGIRVRQFPITLDRMIEPALG